MTFLQNKMFYSLKKKKDGCAVTDNKSAATIAATLAVTSTVAAVPSCLPKNPPLPLSASSSSLVAAIASHEDHQHRHHGGQQTASQLPLAERQLLFQPEQQAVQQQQQEQSLSVVPQQVVSSALSSESSQHMMSMMPEREQQQLLKEEQQWTKNAANHRTSSSTTTATGSKDRSRNQETTNVMKKSPPASPYKLRDRRNCRVDPKSSPTTKAASTCQDNLVHYFSIPSPVPAVPPAVDDIVEGSFVPPPDNPYPLGTQIKKFFKEHRAWYRGTILSYNDTAHLYKVQYKDGDEEELEHREIVVVTKEANDDDVVLPPPEIPYEVGTWVKKFFYEYSGWYEAKIISYNSKTYLYKIEYEDGDQEELDHDEINTEPFPMQPVYRSGMKIEQYFVGKNTKQHIGWLVGEIVSRFLYIPGHLPRYGKEQKWMYGVEYIDNDAEDLDENQIKNIMERMQQRKHKKESKSSKSKSKAKSRTNTTNGTNEEDTDDDDDGSESNDDELSVSSSSEHESDSETSLNDDTDDDHSSMDGVCHKRRHRSSMDDEEYDRRKKIPHWTGKVCMLLFARIICTCFNNSFSKLKTF